MNFKNGMIHWITQGCDFHTNYTRKVEIVLPKLDTTKIITCNLHVYDLQVNHNSNMIIGRDIFYRLKIENFV